MKRRTFLKTAAAATVLTGLVPSAIALSNPTQFTHRSKEYWKQYFRNNTQEYNIMDMIKYTPKQDGLNAYAALVRKRYSEDTYVQMKASHTDIQIDNLPNKDGTYLIFRMFFSSNPTNTVPEIIIQIVSTPIILEV